MDGSRQGDSRRALALPGLPAPRTPPEIREALRRRVYLGALGLGLPALLAIWRLEGRESPDHAVAGLIYPLLVGICLWGLWLVYTRRPLRAVEYSLYLANTAAVMAQFALVAGPTTGDVPLVVASTHLLLIANAILGYLMFSIRTAATLSLVTFALGVMVNAMTLLGRGETADAVTVTRLHVSAATLLLMVYALAWYRSSFQKVFDENALLERQALTDPLTGLPNRRASYAAIEDLLERARAGQPGSVLLLDVDAFKRINDDHGHATGDQVLIDLSRQLLQKLKPGQLPGRWGGEEFLIVLPGLDLPAAADLAERLRAHLGGRPHRQVGTVTASFGVAAARPGDDLRRLTARADHALYRAKAEGRNRVVVQDEEEAPSGSPGAPA